MEAIVFIVCLLGIIGLFNSVSESSEREKDEQYKRYRRYKNAGEDDMGRIAMNGNLFGAKSRYDFDYFESQRKKRKSYEISEFDGLSDQDKRKLRAEISRNMRIIKDSDGEVVVRGESGKNYKVTRTSCTCPDFKRRNAPCKHMYFAAQKKDWDLDR